MANFKFSILETERALLSPLGFGRQTISGNRVLNCLPGIPGVPIGAPLNFPNGPTPFTGAALMACLPSIRTELVQNLANSDQSIQAIQLTKQASGLSPADVPGWSALHLNVGMQRQVARDFVVSADFAYRHFDHVGLGPIDLNHFNSALGPVIPRLVLPKRYSFGDNFQTLDLRLSREFVFAERWRLSLIGEVFNVYNAANLSGYSGNLTGIGFGQPTARVTQVFGSGGPRAFQFGMRISF